MAPTALFVLPEYTGAPWEPLPNLKRSAWELAVLLEDHAADVRALTFSSIDELTQSLADIVSEGGEALLVYVGGHGIVHARRHYTALDTTPLNSPSSRAALWSGILAELLAGRGRDVLVVLDSCFAGEGAAQVIADAVSALADLPDAPAFGVVASCRALGPAQDGLFAETLLALVREGPVFDINAWGPGDERIRTGALATELEQAGFFVSGNLKAGELRLLPNPSWNAGEPEGRVNVKAALRRLSRDAGAHLIEKSAHFVGRAHVRREIAEWLASEPRGTFVVTGGPGTGKSALMGLLARQSVGDPVAAALSDAPALAPGTFDVIVHARQKTLEAVREELSAVLVGDARTTVLVDALDEAVSGEAPGIAAHLASLTRRRAAAIVVGTRPGPVVAGSATVEDSLLRELVPHRLFRLDDPSDDTTRQDIAEMVRAQLLEAEDSPYQAEGVPINEIVELTAATTTPSFLFAQTTARWLCSRDDAISDVPGWRKRSNNRQERRDLANSLRMTWLPGFLRISNAYAICCGLRRGLRDSACPVTQSGQPLRTSSLARIHATAIRTLPGFSTKRGGISRNQARMARAFTAYSTRRSSIIFARTLPGTVTAFSHDWQRGYTKWPRRRVTGSAPTHTSCTT